MNMKYAFSGNGWRRWIFLFILTANLPWGAQIDAHTSRQILSLAGPWKIAPDPENRGLLAKWYEPGRMPEGKSVDVPAEWETALGVGYDGIAWYHTSISVPAIAAGRSCLLRFHGAATETRIWINGNEAGGHIGPWTTFDLDITPYVTSGEHALIAVRVDEKVGHNTQGFLPIIAPHFGGLWQDVELLVLSTRRLDDIRLRIDAATLNPESGQAALRVSVPVIGTPGGLVRWTLFDPQDRQVASESNEMPSTPADWQWTGKVTPWEFDRPNLYRLVTEWLDTEGKRLDSIQTPLGFRKVNTDGPRILLNDKDLIVRGVLTWGYYPPALSPNPSLQLFRDQLRYFKACGFNLIKFCLWLPPRRLLDIVDEEGMLAWVEYPTWHPTIDQAHREQLLREYTEMSHHDGNHPSVILRSITCETGPSADVEVIRELYDLLKNRCPGTLVLDDSSWIGWNRIHDFWDDHSYGNNRTWRDTLTSLQKHIETHGVKPLLLGEAIAADTWVDLPSLEAARKDKAWWLPRWIEAQADFEAKLRARFTRPGYDPVADLHTQSLRYAMDMRRLQLETYREKMPHSGYVVSTIRDVTLCAMGLLDNRNRPKWPVEDWAFHGLVMVSLNTPHDQRAFRGGNLLRFTPKYCFLDSNEHSDRTPRIEWKLDENKVTQNNIKSTDKTSVNLKTASITKPIRKKTIFSYTHEKGTNTMDWELWALPEARQTPPGSILYADSVDRLHRIFPTTTTLKPGQSIPNDTPIVIAGAMSKEALDYLCEGGRVLHLTCGQAGSFKDENIWFLRGTAWTPPVPESFLDRCPGSMLSYLQLFELGGNSVIRGEALWEQVDPLLAFIETHDLTTVRPNLLLFQTKVGTGRLIVSCLRHEGGQEANYAGYWLARELADYLYTGPEPTRSLHKETIETLYDNLSAETLTLDPAWRFRLDPENTGLDAGYSKRDFDDSHWQPLNARSTEEGQIWNRYDGWGWYRKTVTIPSHWKGRRIRLVFDSVDDMYHLYVNGRLAGGYGRQDRSESSFLKRTWVEISDFTNAGSNNILTVRVYDWVGAGGLNGAVWLTTGSAEEKLELLRR
ncbi:MAG: hypothetical protein JW828_07305 [Sedimentisphaerales bacterium]|nr:hypothetical protein [Sedimentisphaerales bacterium]